MKTKKINDKIYRLFDVEDSETLEMIGEFFTACDEVNLPAILEDIQNSQMAQGWDGLDTFEINSSYRADGIPHLITTYTDHKCTDEENGDYETTIYYAVEDDLDSGKAKKFELKISVKCYPSNAEIFINYPDQDGRYEDQPKRIHFSTDAIEFEYPDGAERYSNISEFLDDVIPEDTERRDGVIQAIVDDMTLYIHINDHFKKIEDRTEEEEEKIKKIELCEKLPTLLAKDGCAEIASGVYLHTSANILEEKHKWDTIAEKEKQWDDGDEEEEEETDFKKYPFWITTDSSNYHQGYNSIKEAIFDSL